MLHLALALLALQAPSGARVVIQRMPAAGLEAVAGVSRRDPSDILHVGAFDVVFYTRVELGSVHYPRNYTGRIWYATSGDGGHIWIERGLALDHGKHGSFDSAGVFDPCVLRDGNGSIYLYYAAIGASFNFRLEASSRTNSVSVGVAQLSFGKAGELLRADRLRAGPVLRPSSKDKRGFDSLRVHDPSVLLRDGQFHLYYQGLPFATETDRSAMGLVVSENPDGPFVRGTAALPALALAHETVIWPHAGGTLALVSQSNRGLYWSSDGFHFARIIERVEGTLNEPGIARASASQQASAIWGLHVARYTPDIYLERFEFKFMGEIPTPPVTLVPTASEENRAAAAGWLAGGSWLDQHADILAMARRRPTDVVLLGDSITQNWGGPGRQVSAPGKTAFTNYFGDWDAVNYGISGDRTQHILWRIDEGEFQRGRSQVVVLLIGTNNIGSDTPHEIAAGIFEILTRLRRVQPQSEVLLLGLLPRGENSQDKGYLDARETNRLLAAFDGLPRVTFRDLTPQLAGDDGLPLPELYNADSLHLAPIGYETLAKALQPEIARLMEIHAGR